MDRNIKVLLILWGIIIVSLFIQSKVYGSFIQDFETASWKICTESKLEYRYTDFCQSVYSTKYTVNSAYIWQDLHNQVMNR